MSIKNTKRMNSVKKSYNFSCYNMDLNFNTYQNKQKNKKKCCL